MAEPVLLVDAMNVIGARPDGWWRDRDAALRRLVVALDRYAAATGTRVVVVADGRPPDDLPEGRHGAVVLRFARRGGPDAADDRLVEWLDEAGGGEHVEVVTADRDLRQRARERGALLLGPKHLWHRLDEHATETPSSDADEGG